MSLEQILAEAMPGAAASVFQSDCTLGACLNTPRWHNPDIFLKR